MLKGASIVDHAGVDQYVERPSIMIPQVAGQNSPSASNETFDVVHERKGCATIPQGYREEQGLVRYVRHTAPTVQPLRGGRVEGWRGSR